MSVLALVPFARADTIELLDHPNHEFSISKVSYEGHYKSDSDTNYLQIKNIKFVIDQKGEQDRKINLDGGDDEYASFKGNETVDYEKNWLFYKSAENCSIEVVFYDYYADENKGVKIDCAETDNGNMKVSFNEKHYEIVYAVKHLTEPTRFFNLMYLWDMTKATENDGDGLSLR